jgi:uncharacterized membrane protein
MPSGFGLLLLFGIGVTAGLRTMTAPAVVAWAAHLGWINLSGSPLVFMGSVWAVALFTIGALVEYILDQRPSAHARTDPGPLTARIVTALLTGSCLAVAEGASTEVRALIVGALIAAVGALAGAFGGYQARVRLVRRLRVPDAVIAIPEDLFAIGLGLLCCFQIPHFRIAMAAVLAHVQSRALL